MSDMLMMPNIHNQNVLDRAIDHARKLNILLHRWFIKLLTEYYGIH